MRKELNMLFRLFGLTCCLCSVCLLASCVSARARTETYGLETLTLAQGKLPAPSLIVEALISREGKNLDFDRSEGVWTNVDELFAVQTVDLTGKGKKDLLVYPAKYLPSFFGAHAIRCWVFKAESSGTFRLVLDHGMADQIAVLKRKTNGMHDLELDYVAAGGVIAIYRWDGQQYRLYREVSHDFFKPSRDDS